MDEFKNRKTPRLKTFDYNTVGVYFITICTENRKCILSHVVGTGVPDCPCPPLIDRAKIELTPYGEIAEKYINQLNDFYDHLSIEHYVIMPNHIHLLLFIKGKRETGQVCAPDNGQSRTTPDVTSSLSQGQSRTTPDVTSSLSQGQSRTPDNGQSRTPVPTNNIERANSTFSQFLSTFKRFCNKEYGHNIWQERAFDHIIRNREDYEKHIRYIYENPMRWYYDDLYSDR